MILCLTTRDPEVLASYRNEWLRVLRENPGESRSKLKRSFCRLRSWLNRHDKEWFADHQLPARKRMKPITDAEWEVIDQEIAKQLRLASIQIKTESDPPIRVTKYSIEKLIGKPAIFRTKAQYLPASLKALEEVIETYESYATRRIRWKSRVIQKEEERNISK